MTHHHPSIETLRRPARWFAPILSLFSARTQGRLLLAAGFYLMAHAAYDEYRGIAAPPVTFQRYRLHPVVEHRTAAPDAYRSLMSAEWVVAALVLLGGGVISGFAFRAELRDPFSPDFAGNAALDECERVLDAKIEQQHRPLR